MTVSFEIPLGEIKPENDGSLVVVAHAVVKNGNQEETGFANCAYQPIITTLKARFQVVGGEKTHSAESEGARFSLNPDYWCYWLVTNVYEGEATYKIGSWGNYYGKMHVFEHEGNLMIEVIPDEGFKLLKSWVYVGTMNGLLSYLSADSYDGVCPEYWDLPLSDDDTQGNSHLYSMPIPEPVQTSISFEQAFNIKRWGWISYYYVQ